MAYKVVAADDYLMPRQVIAGAIAMSDRYELAASLASAEEAAEYCLRHPVDLLIMDVVMARGISGLEAAERVRKSNTGIRIILMTSMPEVSYIEKARKIGVDSFWYKEVQEIPILELMDRTMNGEHVYPEDTPAVELGNASSKELTRKELEILRELTGGATNQEIAEKFGIKTETVKMHISNMLQKTGFRNRLELAVKARVDGLVIKD